MKEPKAPAKRIVSTWLDALLFHQQLDAGIERGLGELDGAHVVLGHGDARLAFAFAQQIGEGAAVLDDARRCAPPARRRRRRLPR